MNRWRLVLNTFKTRQNGRHFPDDIVKCKSSNENIYFDKYFTAVCSRGPMNDIPALVQIMAWRRPGDNQLSEAITDTGINDLAIAKERETIICAHFMPCIVFGNYTSKKNVYLDTHTIARTLKEVTLLSYVQVQMGTGQLLWGGCL